MSAVVFDLPTTQPYAEKTISKFGLSEPLPPDLVQQILPGQTTVSEPGRIPVYFLTSADNRLVIGSRGYLFNSAEMGDTHHIRRLATNAFAGLGYNGRGVPMATMMGKQLAELVLGGDVDMPIGVIKPIPLHLFHPLGVSIHVIYSRTLDKYAG